MFRGLCARVAVKIIIHERVLSAADEFLFSSYKRLRAKKVHRVVKLISRVFLFFFIATCIYAQPIFFKYTEATVECNNRKSFHWLRAKSGALGVLDVINQSRISRLIYKNYYRRYNKRVKQVRDRLYTSYAIHSRAGKSLIIFLLSR